MQCRYAMTSPCHSPNEVNHRSGCRLASVRTRGEGHHLVHHPALREERACSAPRAQYVKLGCQSAPRPSGVVCPAEARVDPFPPRYADLGRDRPYRNRSPRSRSDGLEVALDEHVVRRHVTIVRLSTQAFVEELDDVLLPFRGTCVVAECVAGSVDLPYRDAAACA